MESGGVVDVETLLVSDVVELAGAVVDGKKVVDAEVEDDEELLATSVNCGLENVVEEAMEVLPPLGAVIEGKEKVVIEVVIGSKMLEVDVELFAGGWNVEDELQMPMVTVDKT